MIWDKAAHFYDIFEDNYNRDVNKELCGVVNSLIDSEDVVLECACGTGMLSVGIAGKCKKMLATDFSMGMLKKAQNKCRIFNNIRFARANITSIPCDDNKFDKVVAANVIHLLDEPERAVKELYRVCKSGGKVIIPTYVNNENKEKSRKAVNVIKTFGIDFKRQFSFETYQEFFDNIGYNADFVLIKGKMPCAIAILTKS